jgi:hypothetical protein
MRWLFAPLLALSCLTGTGPAGWGAENTMSRAVWPEVWFNPHTPSDMPDMWTDTAPWQNAAKRVNVLELVHWWVDSATDAQVLAMTDFAKRHGMKIDLEIESITRFATEACGHTEGYTPPDFLTGVAAKLLRLGVHVDIMTMDGPVWFGHYNPDPNDCYLSVPDLVGRVSSNISGVIALYPNIQLYQIEPIPATTNFPDWRDILTSFRAGMAKATGKSIRAMQLDTNWSTSAWIPAMQDMYAFVHHQNMLLGVILDGSGFARNDADWMTAAEQHFEYFEGTLGIIPDEVIFTTWQDFPAYNMPETSPTAQTWLINRYFRDRVVIDAQFVGQGAKGKLTSGNGQPIANATVNGYVPGVDFGKPLPTTVIQDVVPSNAAYALLGIRLNAECVCQGINDVLVGQLQYHETQGGSRDYSYLYPPVPALLSGTIVDGEWVGGTKVTRIITTAAQNFYANSDIFPVTPGAQFTLTLPASTIGGAGWYGNLFLLWADANVNGLNRITFIPDPGKRVMSTATTAADGTFQLPRLPRVGPGSVPVTVGFEGDATHRPVGWQPLK